MCYFIKWFGLTLKHCTSTTVHRHTARDRATLMRAACAIENSAPARSKILHLRDRIFCMKWRLAGVRASHPYSKTSLIHPRDFRTALSTQPQCSSWMFVVNHSSTLRRPQWHVCCQLFTLTHHSEVETNLSPMEC